MQFSNLREIYVVRSLTVTPEYVTGQDLRSSKNNESPEKKYGDMIAQQFLLLTSLLLYIIFLHTELTSDRYRRKISSVMIF